MFYLLSVCVCGDEARTRFYIRAYTRAQLLLFLLSNEFIYDFYVQTRTLTLHTQFYRLNHRSHYQGMYLIVNVTGM